MFWIVYALCIGAAAWHCRHEIDTLLFFDEFKSREIPHARFLLEMHRIKVLACVGVLRAIVLCLLAMGYTHAYESAHIMLVAKRDAARQTTPPWHCEGNTDWDLLSWSERAFVMFGRSEEACAEYLAHTQMGVWPSPMVVFEDMLADIFLRPFVSIGDALGKSLALLLGHHSYFAQVYLLLLLPILVIVGCFAWPWYQANQRTAQFISYSRQRPVHPLSIEEDDMLGGDQLLLCASSDKP